MVIDFSIVFFTFKSFVYDSVFQFNAIGIQVPSRLVCYSTCRSGYALFEIIVGFILLVFFSMEGGGALSFDHYYIFRKEGDIRNLKKKNLWAATK